MSLEIPSSTNDAPRERHRWPFTQISRDGAMEADGKIVYNELSHLVNRLPLVFVLPEQCHSLQALLFVNLRFLDVSLLWPIGSLSRITRSLWHVSCLHRIWGPSTGQRWMVGTRGCKKKKIDYGMASDIPCIWPKCPRTTKTLFSTISDGAWLEKSNKTRFVPIMFCKILLQDVRCLACQFEGPISI